MPAGLVLFDFYFINSSVSRSNLSRRSPAQMLTIETIEQGVKYVQSQQ